MSKTAFITGVTGQDGGYLAEFLCKKGYEVHGLVRYDVVNTFPHLDGVCLHYGDLTDAANITKIIKNVRPDEIYNLGAMSHVKVSFETPSSALDMNAKGALNIFEAVRLLEMQSAVRIYQASSSEMFGAAPAPQNEDTEMHPVSPYGVSKLAAYWLARTYRNSYDMFIANGILFNHESPMRGREFVTRKIARAVAEIEAGRREPLILGNLDSVRDWGFAGDYVEGMWAMLQQECADDFVLATGQAKTVREFVVRAFAQIGVDLGFEGEGLNEKAVCTKSGQVLVEISEEFFRPLEVDYLLGDASKARDKLGWKPKMDFDALVSLMINAEREALRAGGGAWQSKAG